MPTSSDFKVITPLMPWGVRRTPATAPDRTCVSRISTLKRRYHGSAFRTRRCPADGSALQEIWVPTVSSEDHPKPGGVPSCTTREWRSRLSWSVRPIGTGNKVGTGNKALHARPKVARSSTRLGQDRPCPRQGRRPSGRAGIASPRDAGAAHRVDRDPRRPRVTQASVHSSRLRPAVRLATAKSQSGRTSCVIAMVSPTSISAAE
jgi:hypothetical protein